MIRIILLKEEIMSNNFVASGAKIIKDVILNDGASVWYNAVLRGDHNSIIIGESSNVQDNSTIHVGADYPCIIGDYVSIGHNAIIHGATIDSNVLVGMGACIMNGARIGENSIIAAKALVTENMIVPPNSLVVGIPGRVVRSLTQKEIESIRENALNYVSLWQEEYK